jgi:hypothetical protein
MNDLPTDILMQLVRARYTCLVQLRDLGRRQSEMIDEGNVTGLLDLLSVKQKPLGDIQRIEKALDPYREQDPENRSWRSPEDRAACARLVVQCEELLKEIVAREQQCEEIMVQNRDATALRLQQLRSAGRAQGAYAAPAGAGISQIDLSSGR